MPSESGPGKTIALVGFMGCGKTAIGKELSLRLSMRFVDMDAAIESKAGALIPSLFANLGEAGFRKLEQEILVEISESPRPIVLSCGGGVVVLEANRLVIRERFLGVWIDVPEDELVRRLESDRGARPVLGSGDRKARVHELLQQRSAWYASTARYRYGWVSGDGVRDSADRILDLLGL